jgi:hypothetical protein
MGRRWDGRGTPPLVEDLAWFLETGETWEGSLRRLGKTQHAVTRQLQRYGRMDLAFRLRRDWEGFEAYRARRRANRPLRRLDDARRREDARRAGAGVGPRRAAYRLPQPTVVDTPPPVVVADTRRAREEMLRAVVRERFPVLMDPAAMAAELGQGCLSLGCPRARARWRRYCEGHLGRFKRFGYTFPEVPLERHVHAHGALRRAVERRAAELAAPTVTAKEEAA